MNHWPLVMRRAARVIFAYAKASSPKVRARIGSSPPKPRPAQSDPILASATADHQVALVLENDDYGYVRRHQTPGVERVVTRLKRTVLWRSRR